MLNIVAIKSHSRKFIKMPKKEENKRSHLSNECKSSDGADLRLQVDPVQDEQ